MPLNSLPTRPGSPAFFLSGQNKLILCVGSWPEGGSEAAQCGIPEKNPTTYGLRSWAVSVWSILTRDLRRKGGGLGGPAVFAWFPLGLSLRMGLSTMVWAVPWVIYKLPGQMH